MKRPPWLLYAAVFLAYANVSAFYRFVSYMESLAVPPAEFGLLIGIFSAASLVARPVLSPQIHAGNVRPWLIAGATLAAASLAAYSLAAGFWSLVWIRMLHGLAFTVLGASLMTLFLEYVPENQSARFFGFLAIITMLPNTMVPPLVPFLESRFGGFGGMLLLFAALNLAALAAVLLIGRPRGEQAEDRRGRGRLTWPEVREDLSDKRVMRILLTMLCLYGGHAMVFFFLAARAESLGLVGAGFFFTLSSGGEIGVRVLAGSWFDRMDKGRTTALTLVALAAAFAVLAWAGRLEVIYGLGAVMGLGWGVAMPVLNAAMFDVSPPRFRAFNSNLGLQMFQAGFFLGPLVGGLVVGKLGYGALFLLCAAVSLAGAATAWGVTRGRAV